MDGYKAGWKVVRVQAPSSKPDFTFESCTEHSGISYQLGRAVKPPPGGGPLCVFGDKDSAIKFVKENFGTQEFNHFIHGAGVMVFPCQYKPSAENRIWSPWVCNGARPLDGLPFGTVLAEEITIYGEPVHTIWSHSSVEVVNLLKYLYPLRHPASGWVSTTNYECNT